MFKKIFLSIFALSVFCTSYVQAQTVNQTADYISGISVNKTELEGGSTESVPLIYKRGFPSDSNLILEYGVAKEVKKGYTTYFETLSTEVVSVNSVKDSLSVSIPNILVSNPNDTYIIYAKTYRENDPDSEHFVTSKSFSLKPGNNEFVSLKYANFLQSNGKRYDLNYGPTIYNPNEITNSSLATSASLEITFESNTETVLKPVVSFSKLRTDNFSSEISLDPISVNKGDTYIKIPLPNFDYVPGVYIGTIKFNNDLIKDIVSFQFIVAGDSVTIGQVTYNDSGENHSFTYEVFETPVDFENLTTKNSDENIYNVSLSYMKEKKVVFTDNQSVDFQKESFESVVSKKYKNLDSVNVVVTSKDGKVVYEGNKDLGIKTENQSNVWWLVLISVIAISIITLLFWRPKKKTESIITDTTIASLVFILGATQVFAVWTPPSSMVTSSQQTYYKAERIGYTPNIQFNEDLSSEVFQTGESLDFLFRTTFKSCNNVNHSVYTGFSTLSGANAISTRTAHAKIVDADHLVIGAEDELAETVRSGRFTHTFYKRVSTFARADMGNLDKSKTHLYAHVFHDVIVNPVNAVDGQTNYKIPLRVAPPVVTNLTAKTSDECGGKIDLSWTTSNGATSYKVYRSDSETGVFSFVNSTSGLTFTDTAPEVNKIYYYKVSAVDDALSAESDLSAAVSAMSSGVCGTDGAECKIYNIPLDVAPSTNADKCVRGNGSNVTTSEGNYVWSCTGNKADGTVETKQCSVPIGGPVSNVELSVSQSCSATNPNIVTSFSASGSLPITYKVYQSSTGANGSFTEVSSFVQNTLNETTLLTLSGPFTVNSTYYFYVNAKNALGEQNSTVQSKKIDSCDTSDDICPDGSPKPASGVCPDGGGDNKCPDGSPKPANGQCPGGNGGGNKCPDGSPKPASGVCPTGGGPKCPDGSDLPCPGSGSVRLNTLLAIPPIVNKNETCKVYLRKSDIGSYAFTSLGDETTSCSLTGQIASYYGFSGTNTPANFNPLSLFNSTEEDIYIESIGLVNSSIFTLKCGNQTISTVCRLNPSEIEVSLIDTIQETTSQIKESLLGTILFFLK